MGRFGNAENLDNEARFIQRVADLRAAQEKLINDFQDILGPRTCPIHGDGDEFCDHVKSDMEPDANTVLGGWVLIHQWLVMDKGMDADRDVDYIDYIQSRGQGSHITIGLMECIKAGLLP